MKKKKFRRSPGNPIRLTASRINGQRKKIAFMFFAFAFFAAAPIFSETRDEVRQFIEGGIADKTQIIVELDMSEDLPERVKRLPRDAIEFVIAHREDLGDTYELENLCLAALAKLPGNSAGEIALLSQLLAQFPSPRIASAIVTRFSDFVSTNPAQMKQVVPGINSFLQKAFVSGASGDVVRAAIRTLGVCGDPSSFDILLGYALQAQDPWTAADAQNALDGIGGSEQNFLRALSEHRMPEKLQIFRFSQNQQYFSEEFKAKCAEIALAQAIIIARDSSMVSADVVALQIESLAVLVRYEWTQSSALVLSLFPAAQKEYEAGIMSEDLFIQVIWANADLGISGAARILSGYLAVLNSITETAPSDAAPVSAGVLLALIDTLGALGDKSAFDNLLSVTYLDYDAKVIQSAREALAKLKW
jgi:hypothetical protein